MITLTTSYRPCTLLLDVTQFLARVAQFFTSAKWPLNAASMNMITEETATPVAVDPRSLASGPTIFVVNVIVQTS